MFQKPRLCSVGVGFPDPSIDYSDGVDMACYTRNGNEVDEDCVINQARRILKRGSILPEGIIETIISALNFLKFSATFLGVTTAKWILTLALQTLSTFVHIGAWKIRAISRLFDALLGINHW